MTSAPDDGLPSAIRTVVPVERSRRNRSNTPLVSFATSVDARELKTTMSVTMFGRSFCYLPYRNRIGLTARSRSQMRRRSA
jgi:hypothetical protein